MNGVERNSKTDTIIQLLPIILFFGALLLLVTGALMSTNEKKTNAMEKRTPESFVGYRLDDACDYYTRVEECILQGYCDENEYRYITMPSIRFDDGIVNSEITCHVYETDIKSQEVLYVSEFFYEREDVYDHYGDKDGYKSSKYYRASPLDETRRRGVMIRE